MLVVQLILVECIQVGQNCVVQVWIIVRVLMVVVLVIISRLLSSQGFGFRLRVVREVVVRVKNSIRVWLVLRWLVSQLLNNVLRVVLIFRVMRNVRFELRVQLLLVISFGNQVLSLQFISMYMVKVIYSSRVFIVWCFLNNWVICLFGVLVVIVFVCLVLGWQLGLILCSSVFSLVWWFLSLRNVVDFGNQCNISGIVSIGSIVMQNIDCQFQVGIMVIVSSVESIVFIEQKVDIIVIRVLCCLVGVNLLIRLIVLGISVFSVRLVKKCLVFSFSGLWVCLVEEGGEVCQQGGGDYQVVLVEMVCQWCQQGVVEEYVEQCVIVEGVGLYWVQLLFLYQVWYY